MKLDYNILEVQLHEYRIRFLMRKNVNGYKKTNKNTPIIIDKLINSFDRKIKGLPIFTHKVKEEYFKGIKEIFNNHYDDTFCPKLSRKRCYIKYQADQYCIYGKNYKSKTYKEFINAGMANKYR